MCSLYPCEALYVLKILKKWKPLFHHTNYTKMSIFLLQYFVIITRPHQRSHTISIWITCENEKPVAPNDPKQSLHSEHNFLPLFISSLWYLQVGPALTTGTMHRLTLTSSHIHSTHPTRQCDSVNSNTVNRSSGWCGFTMTSSLTKS